MRLVQQRGVGDCGIAALATYLGQSYEDVYTTMAAMDPAARGKSGTTFRRLIKVAGKLGVALKLRLKIDLDEQEGLLGVEWLDPWAHPSRQHVVVLFRGLVIDPADGEILDAEEYMERNHARAVSMLELVK